LFHDEQRISIQLVPSLVLRVHLLFAHLCLRLKVITFFNRHIETFLSNHAIIHASGCSLSNLSLVHEFQTLLRCFGDVPRRNRLSQQLLLLAFLFNFLLKLLKPPLLVLGSLLPLPHILLYRHTGGVP
jgi:hypothetical protein